MRTVLCCIVYSSCAHCTVISTHNEQFLQSLDWVLSHWAHFTVHRSFAFICVFFVCFCLILHNCYIIVSVVRWT